MPTTLSMATERHDAIVPQPGTIDAGLADGVASTPPRRLSSRPVWYSIGDLAREFDVTLRALRFYEAKGMLNPIRQNATRVYGPKDRVKLRLILTGKRLGFTLTEISSLIAENEDASLASLRLNPEMILRQIAFLEDQQRTTEASLAELRRHYYLMVEIDRTDMDGTEASATEP